MSRAKVCKFIKYKSFMNLYLINAATDAKRQVYLHMTEAQDLEFAKQIKNPPQRSGSKVSKKLREPKTKSPLHLKRTFKFIIWIRT